MQRGLLARPRRIAGEIVGTRYRSKTQLIIAKSQDPRIHRCLRKNQLLLRYRHELQLIAVVWRGIEKRTGLDRPGACISRRRY